MSSKSMLSYRISEDPWAPKHIISSMYKLKNSKASMYDRNVFVQNTVAIKEWVPWGVVP